MPQIPFAHQWTIEGNRLLPLKDSVNGFLYSTSALNIPEFEYYLTIYPNGDSYERRGQTWIYLHLEFKNAKKVVADFTFTIESSNYSRTDNYIYEKSMGWGRRICISDEFFDPEKKYIIDGKFTIKVNGFFKYETAIPDEIGFKEQKWIGGKLGDEFWKRNDNKDFAIITSDGNEIKVHKIILDIRSDVFTAMLNSNMKESTENKVTITDFSFKVVETALKIIYECNFDSNLTIDELMELLQFFDKYLLPELKATVESFLIAQISPSTVVRLTNCSILTNSIKLKEKCMEFLSVALQCKTPFADIDELDKDILVQAVKNSFCHSFETKEQ